MSRGKGWDIAMGAAHTGRPPVPDRPLPCLASAAGEILSQLWSRVFASPHQGRCQSCLVTSARPGEGVTQIASGLALIGSQIAGTSRIALVDFNFRRPVVAGLFKLPESIGLLHVLQGKAAIDEALFQVNSPGLDVLPAGCANGSPASSPTAESIRSLLADLKRDYDYLLIDAPSLAQNDLALTLAPLVDGILLAVKAGSTQRDAVIEAKVRIERAGGRITGAVLNQ
jgi:capsular exopolysaccharide synthesis family protein